MWLVTFKSRSKSGLSSPEYETEFPISRVTSDGDSPFSLPHSPDGAPDPSFYPELFPLPPIIVQNRVCGERWARKKLEIDLREPTSFYSKRFFRN